VSSARNCSTASSMLNDSASSKGSAQYRSERTDPLRTRSIVPGATEAIPAKMDRGVSVAQKVKT